MRILYHHRTLADGAEGIHIGEMVKAFRSLGHEVHVQGLAGPNGSVPHGFAGRLKAGLPTAAFELASVATNVVEYLKVRRCIRAIRPDFLYKRHARFDVGALRAARDACIPSVLEVNCLFTAPQYQRFEPTKLGRVAARFERRALEMSDIVLAVSTPLARQIERVANVRPVVLPNGVDSQKFHPSAANPDRVRARYRLGSALTIGWSGVIREWHGLELLLDAAATLPDVRLLIVGDGSARATLEERATERGLADRVVITGRIPHEEMPDHVAAMDIAVVASDGTGVASPMKLIEYMAMGRAAVAPRTGNMLDLVVDEVDGLLFSPSDHASLATVLRRLVLDVALRERLGRAARMKIEQSRTWRHNAEHVLTLIGRPSNGTAPMHAVSASSSPLRRNDAEVSRRPGPSV
jgi:glycosyltransferase involved in cell wall biosynthesis